MDLKMATVSSVNHSAGTAVVNLEGSAVPIPFAEGVPVRSGATAWVTDFGNGRKLITAMVAGATPGTDVTPWYDFPDSAFYSGWSNAGAGYQPLQWRREGRHYRIRGHVRRSTNAAVTEAVVDVPQAVSGPNQSLLWLGAVPHDGTRNGRCRIDYNNLQGYIAYVNVAGAGDITNPIPINVRFPYVTPQYGYAQLVSPSVNYGYPWGEGSGSSRPLGFTVEEGRASFVGLIRSAAVGASNLFTWSQTGVPDFTLARPLADQILPIQSAGGVNRLNLLNAATSSIDHVTDSSWMSMDHVEWVTGPLDSQMTAVAGGVGFQNSWVNFGGAWQPAGYVKRGDMVSVRGLVSSGTLGATIFTLPTGYRPPAKMRFPVMNSAAIGIIEIDTDGTIKQAGSWNANSYLSLSGINFSVAT
jgi:hypothetical protein